MNWEAIYNFLHIKEFVYFISAPEIQDFLLPVKLVFMTFAMFFLAGVIYFMINSSWLQYHFLEDVTEFFSWQSYGLREIYRRWNRIKLRLDSGSEAEFKLAIIEAEDFLMEILEDRGFTGKNFEESVQKAGKGMLSNINALMMAHETRNSIVYNPDFKLDIETTKNLLGVYEAAINSVGAG